MMLSYLLGCKSVFHSLAVSQWSFPGFLVVGSFHVSKMPVILFTEVESTAQAPQPDVA